MTTRFQRRQLKRDNESWPETLAKVPPPEWPDSPITTRKPNEVWRSRDFLVLLYAEEKELVRMSVCRTAMNDTGKRFADGISWDDLQRLKSECGFGDFDAVEIYPRNEDIVNVANMRSVGAAGNFTFWMEKEMSKDFFERVGKEVPPNRPTRGMEAPEVATSGVGVDAAWGPKRSWAESDGNFWGTPQSHERLPTGIYRLDINSNVGPVFIRQKNDTDDLVELPDSESARILDEIRQFKTLRGAFREHGFLYKRGILMYGPPGSGKTCTLQLLLKMLVEEHDSIAVLIEKPHIAVTCLQAMRRIEPDRQIVAILEDLDALCERYGESEYLALMDGESQVDNIIFVASTNYPERLDRRFVDRPSRFDTIREIGMPTDAARCEYLTKKVPELKISEIAEYVNASKGYSIAHLRELIILTRCFGATLEDAAARIDGSREKKHSSENFAPRKAIGFP